MTSEASTDTAHAHRIAAEIVSEYGDPIGYNAAVDLVAYAYARGKRDGYREAVDSLREHMRHPLERILEEVRKP